MSKLKSQAVFLSLAACCVLPCMATAQTFDLTVENIMRGPEHIGERPVPLRGGGFGGGGFSWSPDSRYVYFRWKQPGVDTARVIYRVSPRNGEIERFEGADADTILAGPAVWSPDRRQAIFTLDGDLVLWSSRGTRHLTSGAGFESSPVWSADGATVYFQRDGNVFALELETAALRQLTDIRRGNEPQQRAGARTEQRQFLADQEEGVSTQCFGPMPFVDRFKGGSGRLV